MEDLFNDEPTKDVTNPPKTPEGDDVFSQKLSEITNTDGKPKYADVSTALDALKNSQEYIPTLQAKMKEQEETLAKLQAQLEQRESVEDVVNKLLEKQTTPDNTADQQVKGLDEDSVVQLVQNVLSNKELQDKASDNLNSFVQSLTEVYGDNTREEIVKVAQEHGTTPQKLKELATESPGLVLSLFKQTKPSTPALESDFNTNSLKPVENDELAPPSKSLLSGATAQEQTEYMRKIRDRVYKRYGVET